MGNNKNQSPLQTLFYQTCDVRLVNIKFWINNKLYGLTQTYFFQHIFFSANMYTEVKNNKLCEVVLQIFCLKFTFSEKATKIDKIFTINLTVCSNRQIDGKDFVNFCGLLRKRELYDHYFLTRYFQKIFSKNILVPSVCKTLKPGS